MSERRRRDTNLIHPKDERLKQVKVAAEVQRLRDVQAGDEKTERLTAQRVARDEADAPAKPKKP